MYVNAGWENRQAFFKGFSIRECFIMEPETHCLPVLTLPDKIELLFCQAGGHKVKERAVTLSQIDSFTQYLREEEREPGTVEKYLRDVRMFAVWAGNREVRKEVVTGWKEHLKSESYQPETINSKLSAVNRFFAYQ